MIRIIAPRSNRIEIHETKLKLTLKGNKEQLLIEECNKSRPQNDFKTDKNTKEHGYGLKIIEEIVHKYEGNVEKEIVN